MLKLKRILVFLIVLVLLLGIGIQVNATNTTLDLDDFLNSNSQNSNAVTNETTNITTNTTSNTIVQPDTNKQSESGNNLPQTGVTEDITVMFFIIVCVIISIYAYKKIRDYKA